MMRPVPRRAALALLAAPLLAAQAPAPASVPGFLPGSAIGLVPPPGMEPGKGFSGYQDASAGASIVLAALPAPAYAAMVGLRDAELEQRTGIRITQRRAAQAGGAPAMLLLGTQAVRGTSYRKWVLIAGPPALTALVSVQVPVGAAGKYPDRMVEAALATVAFRAPPPVADEVAALPFAVNDMAGFRPVRTAAGSTLLLTEGPLDTDPDSTQPLVVVAWVRQPPVPPSQQDAFARRSLAAARLRAPRVSPGTLLPGAAGDWLVLDATGPDLASNRPMYAVQTLRFTSDGVLQVLGLVRAEARDAMAPRFRQLAASVRLR